MNHNIINKDYAYCSGVTCPIRKECNRYLPNPPDEPLWWISPAFNTKSSYTEITLTDEFETAFRRAMEGGAE